MATEIAYRRDIDGLRAIAVAAVMLYHAHLFRVTGGFVGVDVFFVISGFLISRILLRELQAGTFSLTSFYERRARRILPALTAVLATCFVVGWTIYLPEAFNEFARSVLATLFFASNIWFWASQINYFGADPAANPLMHTWSLGIEEQFYLGFPLLLYVLFRWRAALVRPVMLLLVTASFALAVYASRAHPVAGFFLLPTRAWELGCGVLLALWPRWSALAARPVREAVAAAGVLAIVIPIFWLRDGASVPGLAALSPCLGAAALIGSGGAGPTWVGTALSSRPMVWIGLRSYSLYLWHWPVFSVLIYLTGTAMRDMGPLPKLVAFAIATGLAALSYRFVEQPFRNKQWLSRKAIFAAAGAAILLLIAPAVWMAREHGAPWRLNDEARQLLATADRQIAAGCVPRFGSGWCTIASRQDQTPSFLLWGDSHAEVLQPAVEIAATSADRRGRMAFLPSCAPLIGLENTNINNACTRFNDAVLADLLKTPTIREVMLAGRWSTYIENEDGRSFMLLPNGERRPFSIHWFETSLDLTVTRIRRSGRRVVIFMDVPNFGASVPRAVFLTQRLGWPALVPPSLETYERENRQINDAILRVARRSGADIVPLQKIVCRPVCVYRRGERLMYADSNHLSPAGAAELVGPSLAGWLWPSAPYPAATPP